MLELLHDGRAKIAVVGLGYVGLPLAVAFSRHFSVIGYDSDEEKIADCRAGKDPMGELAAEEGAVERIDFTADAARLRMASFIVVAVPTPIKGDKTPNLKPLKKATRVIGRHLQPGSIVVYESTVYPGVTEDICCTILERESGMRRGEFKIGYSPERINPGDKVHRLENIVKIVSGMDEETLETIAGVYGTVVETLHRAPSIRVAEAAKVAENAQRDINIAFMNELALVFHRMDIDTSAVADAMDTKWNALGFRPGLVGGHCIGVDPYYLTHKAQEVGYNPEMILAGRRINDDMGRYAADQVIKLMIRKGVLINKARVLVLGMTFKENCPDIRNSRVIDVVDELKDFGCKVDVTDPWADSAEVKHEYGFDLVKEYNLDDYDCIVIAVAHNEFKKLNLKGHLVYDIKNIYPEADARL